jgi:hypothetical protein
VANVSICLLPELCSCWLVQINPAKGVSAEDVQQNANRLLTVSQSLVKSIIEHKEQCPK